MENFINIYDPKKDTDSKKFKLNLELLQNPLSIHIELEFNMNSMLFLKNFSYDSLKAKSKTFYNEKNLKNIYNILKDLKEKKSYQIKLTNYNYCEIKFYLNDEEIDLYLDIEQQEFSLNFMEFGNLINLNTYKKDIIDNLKNEYIKEINTMKTEFKDMLQAMNNILNSKLELFKKEINDKISNQVSFSTERRENKSDNKNINNINNIQMNSDIKKIINDLKNEINEINFKLNDLTGLLTNNEREIVKNWINPKKKQKFKLLYSSKIHGFDVETFHKKCDNIPNTLTVLTTETNNKIGGFTSLTWDGNGEEKNDDKTFVFDLKKNKKYNKNKKDEISIFCVENRGPIFGKPCDIGIFQEMNKGFSKKNGCFKTNGELTDGKENFNIQEIEVYNVLFNDF